MIAKISKEETHLKCDNWNGSCVLPAIAEIAAKIILERIKRHGESLIDGLQARVLDPPALIRSTPFE